VRIVDLRGEPRLVHEHRDDLLIARELLVEALDREDTAGEPSIAGDTDLDGAHAALREVGELVDDERLARHGRRPHERDGNRKRLAEVVSES
jgi:hypothetical protein